MKRKWGVLLSIWVLIGLFWSLGTPLTQVLADAGPGTGEEDPSASTTTYLLSTITNASEIVLNGSSPSYTFYIPVSQQWQLTGMDLHLQVSHSDVLRENSTLTVQVNNIPVESVQLTDANAGGSQWDVTVPTELLTGDSIRVSLVGFMDWELRVHTRTSVSLMAFWKAPALGLNFLARKRSSGR